MDVQTDGGYLPAAMLSVGRATKKLTRAVVEELQSQLRRRDGRILDLEAENERLRIALHYRLPKEEVRT